MKRLIEAVRHFWNTRMRAIALVSLVGLLGWLLVSTQPAYAKDIQSDAPQERNNAIVKERTRSYEDALDVINNPRGEQKEYIENLREYREENPNEDNIVEEAKDFVEKIIPGKE